MNKTIALGLTLVVGTAAQAAGPLAVTDVGLDANSAYVWRGYEIADKPALQPTMTVAVNNTPFSLNAWGSMVVQDRSTFEAADEFDLTLTGVHTANWGSRQVDLSGGGVLYTFPQAEKGAQRSAEIFATATLASGLAPGVEYWYDFDLFDTSYFSAGIAPSFPITKRLSLAVAPSIGWGDGDGSFGFQDATVSTSTDIAWSGLVFRPTFGYTYRAETIAADQSGTWAGLGIHFISE